MNAEPTLPGELAAQIMRVTDLRATYRQAGEAHGTLGNFAPAIMLMTNALLCAVAAAGSPAVEAQVVAVRDLQGFAR